MKLTYDPKHSVAYLQLKKKRKKLETVAVCDSLNVDLDSDGQVFGIEFLDVHRQLFGSDGERLVLENTALKWNKKVDLPEKQVEYGIFHSRVLKKAAPSRREMEILKGAIRVLKIHLNPSKIILFDSRAKGTARYGSDFDLAVEQKKPHEKKERQIRAEIEGFTGLYGVDIVFLKSVDRDFRDVVMDTGKIIYEKRIRSCV